MSPRRALPLLAALALALVGLRLLADLADRGRRSDDACSSTTSTSIPRSCTPSPGRLTLQIVNRGRLPHNFRIEKAGREVGRTSALKPGESDRVAVRLTRGDYHYFCSVGNHEELGLYGTLVVR